MKKLVLSLVAALTITLAIRAAAAGITETPGITYLTVNGFAATGNLYVPEGAGPFPGVIYIHGGAFVAGSKDLAGQVAISRFIASRGYIVFNINYRLLQDGGVMPNSTRDVKTAICWFKKNIPALDTSRVGVLGESAGGYLTAMTGVTAGNKDFAPILAEGETCDDTVAAVVPVYPLTNYNSETSPLTKNIRGQVASLSRIRDKKLQLEWFATQSPVTYAANAVPTLLIHGSNDAVVPVSQSREFYDLLIKNGRIVEFINPDDAPHGFFSENMGNHKYDGIRDQAIAFLDKYLKQSADPWKPGD